MNLKYSIRQSKNNLIGLIGEWKAEEWLKEQGYEILPKIYPNTRARGLKQIYGEDYDRILEILDFSSNNFEKAFSKEFYIPDLIVRKKGEKKIILVEVKASTKGKIVFVQEQLQRFKWLDERGFDTMLIYVPVELEINWSTGEPKIIRAKEFQVRAQYSVNT